MLGSVFLPTQSAGNMSSLFFLLSFIVVNVAVIRLRRERPAMNRPYEIPYYPIPPIMGIVLNGVLAVVLIGFLIRTDLLALLLSAGWLGAGAIMYVVLNRFRARGTGEVDGETTTEQPVASELNED
jgi:amino acid transporter